MDSLELWGGYECTVNRVGDQWFDQTPRSGHEHRVEDLALFADLGIRSLRYPALWERISPQHPEARDFSWTDERLGEMRRLGMNPILTLCHHGSGPHYTSLVDPSFAPGLAAHAAAVAQRYPWVRDYTPVNEPLTTARFSALYGYWYPHTKDEGLFWTALLNEIDATRLAMREIRKVNPQARLIQTDDLGYCHATEPLKRDAEFQNERRWIGWDLLCGTVKPGHALYEHVASFGLAERLAAIADDPCPPDVIGINHYLASERLRDHRVELYPDRALADRDCGTMDGLCFVDVDAIRYREEGVLGLPALIEQAWERYGRTIAITECHNGASREEQVRWFLEVWEGAEALRARGVDLVSVTAWSLLGSHDWNRMVTRFIGHYETGVYDVRTGTPRPTLLAPVLKALSAGEKPQIPAIAGPGWWRRPSRLVNKSAGILPCYEVAPGPRAEGAPQPLMIVGDDSDLTTLAIRACEARGLHYVRSTGDAEAALDASQPWAVLDARDRDGVCAGTGATGRKGRSAGAALAQASAARALPCVVVTGAPAWEPAGDVPGLLEIRTGRLFVPWDRSARAPAMLDALDAGRTVLAECGRQWEMVYGPDLMDVALDLLLDGVRGAVSVLPGERLTELQFAQALAMVADCDGSRVVEAGAPAEAKLFAWGNAVSYLPPCESMLERFVRESRAARRAGEFAIARRSDETRLETPATRVPPEGGHLEVENDLVEVQLIEAAE
jgi:dTDP-4-dehydrorhamnose reductase